METFGAEVVAVALDDDAVGPAILEGIPIARTRSGIAISEAVEVVATRDDTNYSLGSVLNHVLLHQTVIGQEAQVQMEMAGEHADVVIGCVGGGSNFAGIAFPFIGDRLAAASARVSSLSSRRRARR